MIKEKAYLDGGAVFAEEMEWPNLSETCAENPLIHFNYINLFTGCKDTEPSREISAA